MKDMDGLYLPDEIKYKLVIADETVFYNVDPPMSQPQGGLQVPLNDADSILSEDDENRSDSPDFENTFNHRNSDNELSSNSEMESDNEEDNEQEGNDILKWSPSTSPQIIHLGHGFSVHDDDDDDEDGEDEDDDDDETDHEDDDDDDDYYEDEDDDEDEDEGDKLSLRDVDMKTILSVLDGIFKKKINDAFQPSADKEDNKMGTAPADAEIDEVEGIRIKYVVHEIIQPEE